MKLTRKNVLYIVIFSLFLFLCYQIESFMNWQWLSYKYDFIQENNHQILNLPTKIAPKAGTFTLLEPAIVGKFSRADNLILFNNTFILPFQPSRNRKEHGIEHELKNNPPFVILHPKTFSICNYTESQAYYSSIVKMDGISIIFAPDIFMSHFFHFLEHLFPTYAGIQELFSNTTQYSVKYAFFPNKDGKYCVGRRKNWNERLLRLLWPEIRIICGQEMKDMSYSTAFALQYAFISMRSIAGSPYVSSDDGLNKMDSLYMRTIKKHSISFSKQILSHLEIQTSSMPHFKEISPELKYRMCYITRENSGRSLYKSVRKQFLEARELHSYFGDKRNLFDFLILRLGDYGFEEQIAVISTCNLIISVHGNGLSHVLWMALQSPFPDAKLVVELLPGVNIKVNDYMLQSEFAHAYHIQWDIYGDKIRSGSLDFGDFTHCPIKFYSNAGRNINKNIRQWTNHGIYHMFDTVQSVWKFIVKDGHYYGMNISELRTELNDSECIDVDRSDPKFEDLFWWEIPQYLWELL